MDNISYFFHIDFEKKIIPVKIRIWNRNENQNLDFGIVYLEELIWTNFLNFLSTVGL